MCQIKMIQSQNLESEYSFDIFKAIFVVVDFLLNC